MTTQPSTTPADFSRLAAAVARSSRPPRPRKPIVLPLDILIDNREQYPYRFDRLPARGGRPVIARSVETCYLPTGDYSLAGCEQRFALERKSLEDLYATLGQNRERFEREFERLAAMDFAAVVVEATLEQVRNPAAFRPDWRSRLLPVSVEGTMVAWAIRYPHVHWWLVGDRESGEARALEAMLKFVKEHEAMEAE